MAACPFVFILLLMIKLGNTLITPTTANGTTEMYINSASTSFEQDSISCTSSRCFVICDITNGCKYTNINASLSTMLTLNCTGISSCDHIHVIGPSNSTQIQCVANDACNYANFNLQNTTNVHVYCNTAIGDGCSFMNVHSEYSTNVDIFCYGDNYGCAESIFHVNYSDNAVFYTERAGLFYSTIYAMNVGNTFNVYCHMDHSCGFAHIYCPRNIPCNLKCKGATSLTSCEGANVYIDDAKNNSLLTTGLECRDESCDKVTFFCSDSSTSTVYVWNRANNIYQCLTDECCPYTYNQTVIHCVNGTDCIIHCTNYGGCNVKYINASTANSLTVYCNSIYQCQYATIHCPVDASCTIQCTADQSCEYIHIYSDQQHSISSLSLSCSNQQSCQQMTINGVIVSDFVNIQCQLMSCISSLIDIRGTSSDTANIEMYLENLNALRNTALHFSNINQINMSCTGLYACDYVNLFASNINNVDIRCGIESCNIFNRVVTANSIIYNCSADRSCRNSLYTTNVTDSISLISTDTSDAFVGTRVDIQCLDCINTYNCLESIIFHCGYNKTQYPLNSMDDNCRNCLCESRNDGITNYIHDVVFWTNMWLECIPTGSPTTDPTIYPTKSTTNPTSIPTIMPSVNPTAIPSSIPTVNPTLNPTERTIEPTSAPTIFYEYGISINIIFEYDGVINRSNNDTEIGNILNRLIVKEIYELNGNDILFCASDAFDVDIYYFSNKTVINSTVFVCNEETQNKLTAEFENDLQKDFVDTVKNETNIDIKVQQIDIDKVDKTLKNKGGDDNEMNYIFIMVVIIILLLLIILLLIILFWYRKRQKTMSNKQIELVTNNDMNTDEHNIERIKSVESSRSDRNGHINTEDNDDDDEHDDELYAPNNNGMDAITAGADNVTIGGGSNESENDELYENEEKNNETKGKEENSDNELYDAAQTIETPETPTTPEWV